MELRGQHKCFGGTLGYYQHQSDATQCPMRFSIFVPDGMKSAPCLFFLSGLTCTEDNFTTKAGAYGEAARLGLVIVAPDTSPRGDDVANSPDYDVGQGAGFYINATQDPWRPHYQMETYIAKELPALIAGEFSVDRERFGISGHSMGGHGALTLYLKYPNVFKSASAFSPIVAPSKVPWGEKAFTEYLGAECSDWVKHDACDLMENLSDRRSSPEILIDQGTADQFLKDQLKPELFAAACRKAGQKLIVRMQDGYDHSYFFIQSFISDHLRHHARILDSL